VASTLLYSSNGGWLSQRHSTQQLIPDPRTPIDLLQVSQPWIRDQAWQDKVDDPVTTL